MQRKIMLSVLGIMIMLCVIFLGYEIRYSKKQEVNNMMAIYLEEEKGTGKYQKTNLYKWPNNSEYALNMHKTYCENGSILRYNLETNKINVKVKGTDKCYVYFDKASYGTEEHPYLIQTIEDLVRLSNKVNAGTTYASEYFLLTNDLDFNNPSDYEDASRTDFNDINGINGNETLIKELTTGSGFKPIGNNSTNSFQGTFDGNNHIINNLYISNNIISARLGFFGVTKNAIINNLVIKGKIKSNVQASLGAFAGDAYSTTVNNVHNEAEITSNSNQWNTAGFFGAIMDKSTIINSTNRGNISGGTQSGGFIGYINPNAFVTIKNSTNYGTIENNIGDNIGGLIGTNNIGNNDGQINIENCENYGSLLMNSIKESGNINAGAIIGSSTGTLNINNCINNGAINLIYNGTGIVRGGGILGINLGNNAKINKVQNANNITVTYKNDKVTSGISYYIGGIAGYNSGQLTISNSENKGKEIKSLVNSKTLNQDLGGILGDNNGTAIVTNSINYSNINGGTLIGGIVGANADGNSKIIIDKCQNYGRITSNFDFNPVSIGGIIGNSRYRSILFILNNYNSGNLTYDGSNKNAYMGGLVGTIMGTTNFNGANATGYIVNSYNQGILQSQNENTKISGIYNDYTAENVKNNIYVNNVYNIGNLIGKITFGIGQTLTSNNTILNAYYLNTMNGSDQEGIGIGKTDEEIKNLTATLNEQLANITLPELTSDFPNYKLSLLKWQSDSNGYPTLDF